MALLYPFTFQPLLKRYLWGGRRLGTALGKSLGEGADYAESWEIADHHQGQSVIANGALAGTTLHELVVSRGSELLGKHCPQLRFPLIFKFLDSQRDLSVQVHPNDAAAAQLNPPDLGKTEAWLILDALPGSRVYAGLKAGCDREALSKAIREGKAEQCLHSFEPRAGQCLFIPAGTVHALGAGLLVAEIQQASDTTYRLYDWNRVGPDGKPRQLHIDQGLDATDYSAVEISPQTAKSTEQPHIERLVSCDKFVLDRWSLESEKSLATNNRFHIVSIVEGQVSLRSANSVDDRQLRRGDTILLPASAGAVTLQPAAHSVLLDMYLPD